jgi:hypothetical protein
MEEVTHPNYIADWDAFKNSVRNSFGDLDCIAMVWLKIKEVEQGQESVDDYIIQFGEFAGFDDAALAEIFKEGLSPQILLCCYGLENIPMTLAAWKEKSRLFSCHLTELQQQQHHWTPAHWACDCTQKNLGSHCGGKLAETGHQIRVMETDELCFKERKDDDNGKGKGKVKEEKEALLDRVKQTGNDRWTDGDKMDLADYLKGKGFWWVLASCCLMQRT